MLNPRSIFLTIMLCAAPAAHAAGMAECAWSRLPEAIRQNYVSTYTRTATSDTVVLKQNMDAAAKVLQDNDAVVIAAAAACIGRTDAPVLMERGLVASRAIQAGAAAALRQGPAISVAALETTWASAPPAAVQCVRANAAKTFGLFNEPCPDAKAPLWFLQTLKINPVSDRAAAEQVLVYLNAKAQDQWAEAFLTKFKAMDGGSKSPPA